MLLVETISSRGAVLMAHDKNWSFGLNNWEREEGSGGPGSARVTKNDGRSEGIKQVFKIISKRTHSKKQEKQGKGA